MIVIKDSIEIETTPEKIFDWFKNLDKHFTEWHPNHEKFVKVTGGMDEGDIIYFEERFGGKLNKYKGKISKIEIEPSGWKVEIKYLFPASLLAVRSLMIVESKGDTCIFTIRETFGFKTPIVGKLIDFLILKVFDRWIGLDITRKDMEEDGKNLKEILEGNY